MLGIGYATPYLGLFREEAERCLALMPAPQGVVRWPSTRPALAALVEEDDLAADRFRGRSRAAGARAGKFARSGRAAARGVAGAAPAAAGCSRWCRTGAGCGRAWTRRRSVTAGPIRARRSRNSCARPGSRRPAGARRLYVPPIARGWFLRSAVAWERTGATLSAPFAGVHIVEATKQVYRAIPARRERRGWCRRCSRCLRRFPAWSRFRVSIASIQRPTTKSHSGHGSAVTAAASAPTRSLRVSRRSRSSAARSAALISATRPRPRNTSAE